MRSWLCEYDPPCFTHSFVAGVLLAIPLWLVFFVWLAFQ